MGALIWAKPPGPAGPFPWRHRTAPAQAQVCARAQAGQVTGTWFQGRSWKQEPSSCQGEPQLWDQHWQLRSVWFLTSTDKPYCSSYAKCISQAPLTLYMNCRDQRWRKRPRMFFRDQALPIKRLGPRLPFLPQLLISTYAQTYWRQKLVHSFTQAHGKKCRCKITPHLPKNYSFCIGNS